VPCDADEGVSDNPPEDGVIVRTVVRPEGIPGPAGMVYVMTSRDAVDEPGVPDEPDPAPDGAAADDSGTVTVRG
jgi:hypothetical protein